MINSYDLLMKRLEALGGNQEERMRLQKLKTLQKALKYSEQAETVIKDGVTHRALLNKNKQKMDYDDKDISIPYDAGFKVGDIFHWVEDSSDWIIYLKEGQDAYFTGLCRKAEYFLRWKDEFNVIHSYKCAVRGPVETKIVSEQKSKISFDEPNYTLYVLVPYNEFTSKLKRYSKVSINEQMWEIAVVDSISEPGILEIQMLEYYTDRDKAKEVINSEVEKCEYIKTEDIKVLSSLDNASDINIRERFALWTQVEKDGDRQKDMEERAIYTVISGIAEIKQNTLIAYVAGEIQVKLEIPKLCYTHIFPINDLEQEGLATLRYVIDGDDKVKSFGANTYYCKMYINGVERDEILNGTWEIENLKEKLYTIEDRTENLIKFKWTVGCHGTFTLKYIIDGEVVASKKITVESLI